VVNKIQIINIGKTNSADALLQKLLQPFLDYRLLLLLPSKIAKNYQKPPLWSTTTEEVEAPDYHINKQPTTYQKSGQIRKSTDFSKQRHLSTTN